MKTIQSKLTGFVLLSLTSFSFLVQGAEINKTDIEAEITAGLAQTHTQITLTHSEMAQTNVRDSVSASLTKAALEQNIQTEIALVTKSIVSDIQLKVAE